MKKIFAIMLGMAMTCGITMADTQHKVQAGETLQSIASRYNVTVDALKAANPKAAKYVYAGMTLTIPGASAAAPAAVTISSDTPAAAAPVTISADTPAAAAPSRVTITANTPAAAAPAISADTPAAAAPVISADMPAAAAPAAAVAPGAPCPANPSVRSGAKKNTVNVEYGSIDAFRQSGTAKVTVDYSQCLVEGQKTVDQWLRDKGGDWTKDWPKESANSHNFLCTMYGFRNKDNMQLSTVMGDYQVVVRPVWIDFGDVGSQFNPFATAKAGGCIMRGTLTLYDPQGRPLCQLWINDVKGLGDFNFESRLRKMYSELGTRLRKEVKD